MKNSIKKIFLLNTLLFLVGACAPKGGSSSTSSSSSVREKSELFKHVDELQLNIEQTPSMNNLVGTIEPTNRISRVNIGEDIVKDLKQKRQKIINGVYMLDTWIIDNQDDIPLPPNHTGSYAKKVSFDSVLDQAILEYYSREKITEGEQSEINIATYTVLKSSYDRNNKMFITGYELTDYYYQDYTNNKTNKYYKQRSFNYVEDNYLNCLTELSKQNFSSTRKEFSHQIDLSIADLHYYNPLYHSLAYVQTGEMINEEEQVKVEELSTNIYQKGVIYLTNSMNGNRTDSGKMSYGMGMKSKFSFYDNNFYRFGTLTLPRGEDQKYHFSISSDVFNGITSYVETNTTRTLTFQNGQSIQIYDIEEENSGGDVSYGYKVTTLNVENEDYSADITLGFDKTIEVVLKVKDQKEFLTNYQNVNSYLGLSFKEDYYWNQISNVNGLSSEKAYSFFNGDATEFITYDEAYNIFNKYVDPDMISVQEFIAIDISNAIEEETQTDDNGSYSIFSTSPVGEVSFDNVNNIFDFSNISLTLLPNPLLTPNEEISLLLALKKENGNIYKILDSTKTTYENEEVNLTLHNNIPLPEIELGVYHLVCYLSDSQNHRISSFYYPEYKGNEYIKPIKDGILNIVKDKGTKISYQVDFFKDANLDITVEKRQMIVEGITFEYMSISADNLRVSLNSSYIESEKEATLNVYLVSDEKRVLVKAVTGKFGQESSLTYSQEDLFQAEIDKPLISPFKECTPGTYHFEAELIIGDNEYMSRADKFNCHLYTDEFYSPSIGITLNSDKTNYQIFIQ